MDHKTLEMIFEDYLLRTSWTVDDVVDYYSGGRLEIIVRLKNGNYEIYDYRNKVIIFGKKLDEDRTPITEEKYKQELKWYLRRAMQFACMTQGELSQLTGISTVTLSKYMNGKSIPSALHLQRMADALNCSITEIGYFK